MVSSVSVTSKRVSSDKLDPDALQKLHIFDILALVFQHYQLQKMGQHAFDNDEVFERIRKYVGETVWTKIQEICQNSRPQANSNLSLLHVINYECLKNQKEADAVSRCASFATRSVVLQSVLHNRSSSNMSDTYNETTLMLSVCMGREHLVRRLLAVCPLAGILQCSTHPSSLGQDAFLMALVANRLDMATMILEHLLQHAILGSLKFQDYSRMLCRIYCRTHKTSKRPVCIPSLLLLIRMRASLTMLDLIHEIALKCSKENSESRSVAAGVRGLILIVSNLRDGLGNNALHHVSTILTFERARCNIRQAIRSNSIDCVNWVLGIIQLDDKSQPLNLQHDSLSQCITSVQDYGDYNTIKHPEPLLCSVARINSEIMTLPNETAQVEKDLVLKYFDEDLDTSPVFAPRYGATASTAISIVQLSVTIVFLRLC